MMKRRFFHGSPLLRLALGLGLGAVALLLAVSVLVREHPDPAAIADRIERESAVTLSHLGRATAKRAIGELRDARRHLQGQHRWMLRCIGRMPPAMLNTDDQVLLAKSGKALKALIGRVEHWQSRLEQEDRSQRGQLWETLVVEVLIERTRMSGERRMVSPRRFRPRDTWRYFEQGVNIATLWPWRVVQGISNRGGSDYGLFRRITFPYGSRSGLNIIHVAGFGVASLLLGYGLCWLGTRHGWALIGYLGLGYFVYMIVFAMGMALMHLGLLAGC